MPAGLAFVLRLELFRLSSFHDLLSAAESIVFGLAFRAGSFLLLFHSPSVVKEEILWGRKKEARIWEMPFRPTFCVGSVLRTRFAATPTGIARRNPQT
jgi:hypothetical protein